MHPALPAGIWCALLLGAQVLRARARGRRPLFAPAAGDPAAGVRYAFTGAMLPWAKESVRMNPVSYAAGIAYHLGIAAAFARVFIPSRALSALALLGAVAGCALLAKRIVKPHLRGLSNADDFVSNLLATGFAALAAGAPATSRLLPWALAALLVYIPLGKIRHCVFFFLSRYHLGAFFGRRGTFPPWARSASMGESIDFRKGLEVFQARLGEADAAHLSACVHCGLCAESCHYYRMDPQLENVPARKLDLVAQVFRRHSTVLGKLGLQGAALDDAMAKAWLDAVYGRCSLCGRCSLNCTVGINLPRVFKAARAALTAMGLVPADLQATVDNSLRHGNNMAITREDWVETVDWLQDELRAETGDPLAEMPMDRHGAKILFTVNPREPKFFPLSLQASAKVFWAAREDWTLASEGWDLTNYGLFNCNDKEAGTITQSLVDAMVRLGCETLVIGECGHGFASARWEGPEWLQGAYPFKVRSFLEVMDEYLEQGRIRVDPAVHTGRVTLHDPCNLVRHGGISEPQRRILGRTVSNFREMTPNRAENFCCGGGGGQLAMGAYKERRMSSGGMKAQQIRDSEAQVVVAPCHNCIDQLSELNKEYKLNVKIKTVAEMVADALVTEPLTGEP